nr:MAG TPA: hypothetical protein [Caudoviricetes sp.]
MSYLHLKAFFPLLPYKTSFLFQTRSMNGLILRRLLMCFRFQLPDQ